MLRQCLRLTLGRSESLCRSNAYPGDGTVLACGEVERVNHREEAVNWSRRYQANLHKLASQDLAKVTEVVRDLELRERRSGLSAGEKRMLDKARHLRQLLSDG